MKKEHKIWWEGLADQYEVWASNPPTFPGEDHEYYTCSAFYDNYVAWGFNDVNHFDFVLGGLFNIAGHANIMYPIGNLGDSDRETKREAFCQDMADTIRENIQ